MWIRRLGVGQQALGSSDFGVGGRKKSPFREDIVALSGAHTVGECHLDRSGFDGPWTEEPLKFDNTYFKARKPIADRI